MLIPIPKQLYVRALIKEFKAVKEPSELEEFCDMVDATLKYHISQNYPYRELHALRHHYFIYLGSMYNRYKVSAVKDRDYRLSLCIALGSMLYMQMYPLDSYKRYGITVYDKDSK